MKIETRKLAYRVASKSCEVLAVDVTAEKLWSLVEAIAPILESGPTQVAADGVTCDECGQAGITGSVCPNCGARGSGLQFIKSEPLMTCGHEEKYIVYSERRNYCGICGKEAHPTSAAYWRTHRR